MPWPTEPGLRQDLARRRVPRLLLIAEDEAPPDLLDELEDWVREGIHPSDLAARSRLLAERAADKDRPRLDDDGILRYRDRWVAVPPSQVPAVELLLAHLDRVVTRAQLGAAYEGAGGSAHPNAVRTLSNRLATRVADVGLRLATIRGRGVMLTERLPARAGR